MATTSKAPALAPTPSGLPDAATTIVDAARRAGADIVLMLATALHETGGTLNWHSIGDNGTSFGLFQHHRGGALGSHSESWAYSVAAVDERARVFAKAKARTGADAAEIQRPKYPTLYAQRVNDQMARAKAIADGVAANTLGTAAGPAPSTTTPDGNGSVVIGGKTFPLNPDGTITYDGKTMTVEQAQAAYDAATGAINNGTGAGGAIIGKLVDWLNIRRVVIGGLFVLGGVALVVGGGVNATRGT